MRFCRIFSRLAERSFEAAVKHASTVDEKAQKTSALAGIFLAVAFGFIKPESLMALRQQYGNLSLGLLYAALILFVGSVVLCLRGMWLRKVPVGGISVEAHEYVSDVILSLRSEYIDDEVMAWYKMNQLRIWKIAIDERFKANIDKTRLVHHAQQMLAAAILVAAVSLALLGFAAGRTA